MPGIRVLLAPCCHRLLHAPVLGNPAPAVIVGFPSHSIGVPLQAQGGAIPAPCQLASPIPATPHWPPCALPAPLD